MRLVLYGGSTLPEMAENDHSLAGAWMGSLD